jgi:hypothetical protein
MSNRIRLNITSIDYMFSLSVVVSPISTVKESSGRRSDDWGRQWTGTLQNQKISHT